MTLDRGAPSKETNVDHSPSNKGPEPTPAPINQPAQPDGQARGSEQPNDQNGNQLQAHTEVTPGTEESMDAAWWGVGADLASAAFSFISICLVVYALIQTNKSLRLAQKDRADATRRAIAQSDETAEALRHAEASALAMGRVAEIAIENAEQVKESVRQQRILGGMQTRPYLSVLIGDAEWQDANHNFAAYPILHNTGQTPARDIRYQITAQILPSVLTPEFRFWLPAKSEGKNIIGPSQTGTMIAVAQWRVPDDWIMKVKYGVDFALYVWGTASYRDNFGGRHRVTFAQKIFWRQFSTINEDGSFPERVEGLFLGRHNRSN